jgi:hypothetical protein
MKKRECRGQLPFAGARGALAPSTISLLLLLLFVLAACARSDAGPTNGGAASQQGSANSLPSNNATPTAFATPTAALSATTVATPIARSQGVQPCPVAVAAPSYWVLVKSKV